MRTLDLYILGIGFGQCKLIVMVCSHYPTSKGGKMACIKLCVGYSYCTGTYINTDSH